MGVPVKKLKPQLARPAVPVTRGDATADQQSAMQQALAQQRALFPVARPEGSAAERAQVSDDEDDAECEESEPEITWYAIVGGPNEGVHSAPAAPGMYDLHIRRLVAVIMGQALL